MSWRIELRAIVGSCDVRHSQRCRLFCFGRLAIITLISRWVHVQCITTIECEGVFGVSDTANITGSG